MSSIVRAQIVLALAAGLVFFTNLGGPDLWDEDEPRNAACAREMLSRGDWVVPTFNEELRTQKPVLVYWLMMVSYSVFGVSEFAARLPSAALALGTTLVTFHLGRLLFNDRAGFLAGLIMGSCLMFGVAGRAATPDSCLIFFATLSMLAFVWAVSRASLSAGSQSLAGQFWASPRLNDLRLQWFDFACIYASLALAMLAKGPVGVALPLAAIGLFLLLIRWKSAGDDAAVVNRPLRFAAHFLGTTWAMRPWTLLLMVCAVAGPWYVLVGTGTEGRWTRTFFGIENLARFQGPMEGHGGPIYYYVGAILVGFFPWSIVLPASLWFSIRDAFDRRCADRAHLLLVCWAGLWIGLFSFAGTKLPSYVLPAYPALAIMAASFVDRWLRQPSCVPGWLMRIAWGSLAMVGIVMTVGLPVVAQRVLPGEEWIGLAGLIPLAGGIVALMLHHKQRLGSAVAAVGVTSVVLCVTMLGFVTVRVSGHQNTAALVAAARNDSTANIRLATFAHPESSVVYYAQGRVERYDDPAKVARFLAETEDAYLITNGDRWQELKPLLPSDAEIVARQPRFLKGGDVFLIKRATSLAAIPTALRR